MNDEHHGQWSTTITTEKGMTLRDHFAAMAMQGMCASPHTPLSDQTLVAAAYQVADAMLSHREQANG